MGELNTAWIPLELGQQQVWDKLEDAPAAGGYIAFYKDDERTVPKNVFVLSGGPPDYTYETHGYIVLLSSIGTLDREGNNFVPYLYPYDSNGNIELYYYRVYNSEGQFQYDVEGVPNVPIGQIPAPPSSGGEALNFIQNGQFAVQNFSTTNITTTDTNFAYPIGSRDGWHYIRSTNNCTADELTFYRFTAPIDSPSIDPSGNPRYAVRISCATPDASDTLKALEYRFSDVNRFSDPTQKLSIFFTGASNIISSQDVEIYLYKYFGSGGSAATSTPIATATLAAPSGTDLVWTDFPNSFEFGSNFTEGKTIGTGDDDYCSIQIRIKNPGTAVFDISTTDFVLKLGEEVISSYPFVPNSYNDYEINKIDTVTIPAVISDLNGTFNGIVVTKYTANGNHVPNAGMKYCTIECWGGGGGGGGANTNVGGGGGAGSYSRKTVSAAAYGVTQVVSVGAAGSGAPPGSWGGHGGLSSVGSLCSANGGNGADFGVDGAGGHGGRPGIGDITGYGQHGGTGYIYSSRALSGFGGSTSIGSGGQSVFTTGSAGGTNAEGHGAGGAGGASVFYVSPLPGGGNGGAGLVVITEYINTL